MSPIKVWKLVALTVTMLSGLLLLLNQTHAEAPNRTAPPQREGRFQIVDGTPEFTKNIMLLDTETGESWIVCTDTDNTSEWCHMERSSSAATDKK